MSGFSKFIVVTLLMLLSLQGAMAIPVKNCPRSLQVEFHSPNITKWYAREAYLEYFSEQTSIKARLKLQRAEKAVCFYEAKPEQSILSARIYGSDRAKAVQPLTFETMITLPIQGRISGDVGSAIIYTRLDRVPPDRVIVSGASPADIYWMSRECSYGECIPDYIYLGQILSEAVVIE